MFREENYAFEKGTLIGLHSTNDKLWFHIGKDYDGMHKMIGMVERETTFPELTVCSIRYRKKF